MPRAMRSPRPQPGMPRAWATWAPSRFARVAHNPPAFLHLEGALAWHARFDGAHVEVGTGELPAGDCDLKVQGDHAVMSNLARLQHHGKDPLLVATAQARLQKIGRWQMNGAPPEHRVLRVVLRSLHDTMAARTMMRFVWMTPEWTQIARHIVSTRAKMPEYADRIKDEEYRFAEVFTETPRFAFPEGSSATCRRMYIVDRMQAPSDRYLLGTDQLGRDLLSRLLFGAQISLTVGLAATAVNVVVAVLIGGPSGFFGGRLDLAAQRFVDAWMAFPGLLLLLTIMSLVGRGVPQIIVVLGVTGGIGGSRVIRGAVIGVKENVHGGGATAGAVARAVPDDRRLLPEHVRRRGAGSARPAAAGRWWSPGCRCRQVRLSAPERKSQAVFLRQTGLDGRCVSRANPTTVRIDR